MTIQFTDFMVDVVPGFYRTEGGYLIPNSITQTWISTDSKKYVEIMANANAAHNGNLVPLIKMIKGWNKNINHYFRSFHLEVLALQILDGVRISDFPSSVRYLFNKRDRLNRGCSQVPTWAYKKAKKGIEEGEADYLIDKSSKV